MMMAMNARTVSTSRMVTPSKATVAAPRCVVVRLGRSDAERGVDRIADGAQDLLDGGKKNLKKAGNEIEDSARHGKHEAKDALRDGKHEAKSALHDGKHEANHAKHEAKSALHDGKHEAKSALHDAKHEGKHAKHEAKSALRDGKDALDSTADDAEHGLKKAAHNIENAVGGAAGNVARAVEGVKDDVDSLTTEGNKNLRA